MRPMTVRKEWTPESSVEVAGIIGTHPLVAVSFPQASNQGQGKIMRVMTGGV